jgi:lipoate-protein ligase A
MVFHESAHENAQGTACKQAAARDLGEAASGFSCSPLPSPLSSLPFSLLITPPAAGAWNMAVDEMLLESAADHGDCALRFYRWEEPTLSLGYFQIYDDRRMHKASMQCPVVRRASGGGAILHDIELTYSLAVPERHPLAIDRLRTYRVIHQTLVDVLSDWGISAELFTGRPRREAFLCFERRSPGDVLVGGSKIAGSAQRRRQGAVLQHGSVLLARSEAAPELDGIKERTGRAIRAEELTEAWSARLAGVLAVTWRPVLLSDAQHDRAAQIAAEKYKSTHWTKKQF